MMKMLRACYDWRVIAALAAVGVSVLILAPNLIGAALPLLLLAACPLSMLLMMKAMGGQAPNARPVAATRPADRAEQLRTELAGTRREHQRLTRQLEELEVTGGVTVRSAEPASSPPA